MHHDWFEGRAKKCCLLVLIDDAISAIVGARFFNSEITQGYLQTLTEYFEAYGLPMALYSDKHSVFKVNTPQAKGRVERANKTLQDRLIKAMRIDGISSMEAGSEYLATFIAQHNEQFAKSPRDEDNAHCVIEDVAALKKILSVQTKRKLSPALELSYAATIFQLSASNQTNRLCRKTVTVCEHYSDGISLRYGTDELEYTVIEKRTPAFEVHDDKTLNTKVDAVVTRADSTKKRKKPAADHPWRRYKRRCTLSLNQVKKSDLY